MGLFNSFQFYQEDDGARLRVYHILHSRQRMWATVCELLVMLLSCRPPL